MLHFLLFSAATTLEAQACLHLHPPLLTPMHPLADTAEVIGTYASEEDEPLSEGDRGEVEERLRRLLVGAPSDRAWRRRGWIVLCRNRVLLRNYQRQELVTMDVIRHPENGGEGKEDPTLQGSGRKGVGSIGSASHAAKVPRTATMTTATALAGAEGHSVTATPSLLTHEPRGNNNTAHIGHGRGGCEDGGVPPAGATSPTGAEGFESGARSRSAYEVVDIDEEWDDDNGRVASRRDLPGAIHRLMGLTEEGVFREIVGFL